MVRKVGILTHIDTKINEGKESIKKALIMGIHLPEFQTIPNLS